MIYWFTIYKYLHRYLLQACLRIRTDCRWTRHRVSCSIMLLAVGVAHRAMRRSNRRSRNRRNLAWASRRDKSDCASRERETSRRWRAIKFPEREWCSEHGTREIREWLDTGEREKFIFFREETRPSWKRGEKNETTGKNIFIGLESDYIYVLLNCYVIRV